MSNLLWIEDEPRYVRAAAGEIRDLGWSVTFAREILEAANKLSTERYDALIMDLMVTGNVPNVAAGFAIWSTYRLLCWLGGSPAEAKAGLAHQWKEIDVLTPMEENRRIPAMILSAYHDMNVAEAMKLANLARVGTAIPMYSKPIDAVRVADCFLTLVAEATPA